MFSFKGYYEKYGHGATSTGLPFSAIHGDLVSEHFNRESFFADDTMLFSVVQDSVKSATGLNHDLNMISQWAHQWKMEFNPDPSKQATEVLFSCKKNRANHPQLIFNGSAVVKVNEQKHLGPILEPGLLFDKHISEKIIKAKRNIAILKYLSKFLPLRTLDQMYKQG